VPKLLLGHERITNEAVMEVEFSLVAEDIHALKLFHRAHLPGGPADVWKRRIILGLAFLGLIAFLLVRVFTTRFGNDWLDYMIISLLILVSISPFIGPWAELSLIRQQIKQNPKLVEKTRLSFTPQELTFSTISAVYKISWTAVERIPMTDNHAFIFTSKVDAWVVPRHAFADDSAFQHFVETARRYHEEARAAAG
jgi:hypothetical protein